MMGRASKRMLAIPPILTFVGLIAAWQVFVMVFKPAPYVLPSPVMVGEAVVDNFSTLVSHFMTTAVEFWFGFLLGTIVGLVLAVFMTVMPGLRSSVYPLVVASQTIPKIAIAPLLILWFGIGTLPKIGIVALLAFFPVLINTITGFDNTNRKLLDLMRTVSATPAQVYLHVRIPAAIPNIFAGMKLALTVSVIGAVVAEWVGAQRGLGYLLILYNSSMRTAELFAVLVFIVAMAATTFLALLAIERNFSWAARTSQPTVTAKADDGKRGRSRRQRQTHRADSGGAAPLLDRDSMVTGGAGVQGR